MDGDEYLEALERKDMIAKGLTEEEIVLNFKYKAHKETLSMYLFLEKSLFPSSIADDLLKSGEIECESDNAMLVEIGLNLALAYEGLGKRQLAIDALRRAMLRCPYSSPVILFLAKLLFRSNSKQEAGELLEAFLTRFIDQDQESCGQNLITIDGR